ncbi:hypothetical protein ACGFSB_22875 [Streptomyces sp. NPDC048441]|uniref:hypothetical protein n=1 Tax=Streptomyces sp. NPDC048441 TaxID=3365552 RepID=UPI003720B9F6
MRTTRIFVRSGLTIAAAAALPLALTAPASAGGGITVTATGSTVTATTTACPNGGNAALMSDGNASFAQGRQVPLTGGSASWQNVSTGVHTVAVVCQDGSSAGSRTVTVGAPSTISSTSAPARGVQGGLGGGSEDRGTQTLVAGGALVALAAGGGGAWYLRRRNVRHRL